MVLFFNKFCNKSTMLKTACFVYAEKLYTFAAEVRTPLPVSLIGTRGRGGGRQWLMAVKFIFLKEVPEKNGKFSKKYHQKCCCEWENPHKSIPIQHFYKPSLVVFPKDSKKTKTFLLLPVLLECPNICTPSPGSLKRCMSQEPH